MDREKRTMAWAGVGGEGAVLEGKTDRKGSPTVKQ